MRVLFVRHGESVDDIEGRYGGWADFPLTDKGIEQIKKTAKKIAKLSINFETLLTSPLKRAQQASEIINNNLDLKTEVFEFLKERNLNGILSGMKRIDASTKYPDLVTKHNNRAYVYGSERSDDFTKRVKESIKLLLNKSENNLICVTHGLYLQHLLKLYGMELEKKEDGGFILCEFVGNKMNVIEEDGVTYKRNS